MPSERDGDLEEQTAQTFTRSFRKAVAGAVLAAAVAALGFAALVAGMWAAGLFLFVVATPWLFIMGRGMRRARLGGLNLDRRGFRDHALPYGWVAWSDVTHLTWNALTATVTLRIRPRAAASQRLNAERAMPGALLPERIVLHTFELEIGYAALVRIVSRRAPLRKRPNEEELLGLYN